MSGADFAIFDAANFDAQVLRRRGLTLVDFWSESCIPCRQLSRILEQLAGEIPGSVLIGKVDSDRNPDLLARFGVRGVPALLFFKDGELVETRTGVDRRQVLKKSVELHAA
jgi:thioredoxin 1